MLDIKFIKENKTKVAENCRNRNIKCDIDKFLHHESSAADLRREIDILRQKRNSIAEKMKNVATLSTEEKNALIQDGREIRESITAKEENLKEYEEIIRTTHLQIPNMTHPDSPFGKDDSENKEAKIIGKIPKFKFTPKNHEELGKALDILDFEKGAKVAGAKFYFLKNEGVLLEQALIKYVLDILQKEKFTLMATPDVAKEEVLIGTGFNPRGPEKQIYNIEGTDLSLIGTSEITMGGYHKDDVIDEDKLPLKYAALSHCFRTEAGAYGRTSAGLYRVHQFTKVEMFIYATPEQSEKMHQYLLDLETKIFKGLGIPFRIVDICTGDLGGPAYRKYDLEAWMTMKGSSTSLGVNNEQPFDDAQGRQGDWGEVTSTSNCTDYQARRLNIKVKRKDGKTEYLHTLNGTAVAISRALIAILENYQKADGSIEIPKVLQKYVGKKIIKMKK